MGRGVVVALVVTGLMVSFTSSPATAGRRKTIRDSWTVQGLPFPVLQETNDNAGCLGGIEGVHKVSRPFEAPAKGRLKAKIFGFYGDWDIHVTDDEGRQLAVSQVGGPVDSVDEEVSLALKAHEQIVIVACNWLGAPEARAAFEFVFRG